MSDNIIWHKTSVSTEERSLQKKHKPIVLWYTGLSGAGKSTIANAVDRILYERGYHTYIIDGDNIRHGLNHDLGFDEISRTENIRRVSEVAKLFVDAGLIVSIVLISPFIYDREQARKIIGDNFIEIFIDAPLAECEKRDPKKLYKKAREGEIANFTGISSPYEKPINPDIHITSSSKTIDECADKIINYLLDKNILNKVV
ncbi:adenylyl-sulfate kinase [Francisella tularensis subsp. novicida]|uniref:Adenylyl-sulfate kinase n=2 Tax=Francisella tularensis TaxID=263 RepID=A0A6I4RY40_FRATU|nr:adenylyl-sulfate kinase [Francisella tularensis]ABK89814.1 adenylylsulfate kinase [Francisella tularensis subsp. novicida U112]AJI60633.1 adenylyl-sulfate kinase [Francisella tularensis subsp. novicida U112]EDX27400.1 adenylylsulfate kinase [Francisella tularensis subsp. novicida FTE]EDZ91415.1 adenylylsulfate kinase [Francisella tularensis subsp. novicida FTG]MBK2035057.1 adenylyl-sulfate kinase [Francisella tularensis subsp. novicida]